MLILARDGWTQPIFLKPPQGRRGRVSMTDETSTPEPKAQIDTIGWLFVATVAVITTIAAMAMMATTR